MSQQDRINILPVTKVLETCQKSVNQKVRTGQTEFGSLRV